MSNPYTDIEADVAGNFPEPNFCRPTLFAY